MSASAEVVKPRTEQQQQLDLAQRDLGDIDALRRSPPFTRYFLRRLDEKLAPLEQAILNDDLPDEVLRAKRMERKILQGIRKLLDTDEAGCRGIIEQAR